MSRETWDRVAGAVVQREAGRTAAAWGTTALAVVGDICLPLADHLELVVCRNEGLLFLREAAAEPRCVRLPDTRAQWFRHVVAHPATRKFAVAYLVREVPTHTTVMTGRPWRIGFRGDPVADCWMLVQGPQGTAAEQAIADTVAVAWEEGRVLPAGVRWQCRPWVDWPNLITAAATVALIGGAALGGSFAVAQALRVTLQLCGGMMLWFGGMVAIGSGATDGWWRWQNPGEWRHYDKEG
jgi:hypothetical protein